MKAGFVSLLLAMSVQTAAQLPPRDTGNIGGMRALMFAPGTDTAKGTTQIGPLAGCTVLAVPDAGRDSELTFPCGEWFLLPKPGLYRMWLEQAGRVSQQISLHYVAEPFDGTGYVSVHTMKPAGSVTVAKTSDPAAHGVRLLSLEPMLPRAFERRVTRKDAAAPVPMPAGRVLAGWFDASGNAVALSRPVQVAAGATTNIVPKPPATGADMLVVLTRPVAEGRCKPVLSARTAGGARAPDAMNAAAERIFAVWYGLPPGRIDVTAVCDELEWEATFTAAAKGKVITSRGRLAGAAHTHKGGAQ